MERMKKKYAGYLIAAVHFCLSFVWKKWVFLDTAISDQFSGRLLGDERDMALFGISAVVVTGLLILIFWRMLILVVSRRRSQCFMRFFAISFGFLLIINLFLFPNTFSFESDNLSVYTSVIMGYVNYWHSYFTCAVYLGMLAGFYHPIAIPIMQSFLWCISFSLFYEMVCERSEKKAYRAVLWIGFFGAYLPYIAMNPYRNCMYAILLFWFTILVLQLYFGKLQLTATVCLRLGILGGVLAFWRSEGILYLVFLPLILFSLYGKKEIKKLLGVLGIMILVFFLGKRPQAVAEQKYYGDDYMMINVISMLSDVMNDEGFINGYQGFEEDIDKISRAYDPQLIKDYHAMAFQVGNYLKGCTDVSRSGMDRQDQKNFMEAGVHILSHHLPAMIFGRIKQMAVSLGIRNPQTEVVSVQIDKEAFFDEIYAFGKIGWDEMVDMSPYSGETSSKLFACIWTNGWKRVISLLGDVQACEWILILLGTLVFLIDSIKSRQAFFGVFFVTALAMFSVVVMFAPESREAYYYPTFYQMLALCVMYLISNEKRLLTERELAIKGASTDE